MQGIYKHEKYYVYFTQITDIFIIAFSCQINLCIIYYKVLGIDKFKL